MKKEKHDPFSCDVFDIREDEIAREILAQLPASTAGQASPEVDTGEFEPCCLWFIS